MFFNKTLLCIIKIWKFVFLLKIQKSRHTIKQLCLNKLDPVQSSFKNVGDLIWEY